MSIKDIIVYVDNDKDCDTRLETASSLCKTFEAQLTGLYLLQKISIPAYAGAYMPVEVFEANDEETIKLRNKAEAVFTTKSESANIISHFNAVEGDVSTALNQYSRFRKEKKTVLTLTRITSYPMYCLVLPARCYCCPIKVHLIYRLRPPCLPGMANENVPER
jgi:hypothetical protein